MPIPSDTIALPIVKGLDVNTDARLLQAPALLEAQNTQFSGGGAKKRRGHRNVDIRLAGSYTSGGAMGTGEEDDLYWAPDTENVDTLLGVASRDNETVLWDGTSLYSYLPSQADNPSLFVSTITNAAVLPALVSSPIAKFNEHQGQPELADNGRTKIVAWINNGDAKYAIYDSDSDSRIATGTFAVTTAQYLRAFTLGDWMHVMVRDSDDGNIKLFSISSDAPSDVTYRSYGAASFFDLWKISEDVVLLVKIDSPSLYVTWVGATGGGYSNASFVNFTHTPAVATTPTRVTASYSEETNELLLVWANSTTVGAVIYNRSSATTAAETSFSASGIVRLTASVKEVLTEEDHDRWDIFWDNGTDLYTRRLWRTGTMNLGSTITRFGKVLASRAFHVGDRTFVWAGHDSDVQATWLLLDEGLLPVGKADFGIANVDGLGSTGWVSSVNWYDSPELQHCALSAKLRVAPDDSAQALSAVYTEPSIKGVYTTFYPQLHAAQAGRSLYIAGAQLWSYDGSELVEAGFHLGPEPTYAQAAGGALTALGTYSYRVDVCHRNAQNEEVRSLSILSDSIELTGGNQTINLTIPTVITRRENSYLLIYRNAMSSGTPLVNWWLLNSRDPEDPSYLANDLSVGTVSYSDTGAVNDDEIQVRELHPSTDTWLQPISAPACEIVAAGRDRLWVAGGELLPGEVAPSRLFDPGETPSFNPYLDIQVDRSNEPVTAIGFVGEIGVLFRENSTYLLDSDGPDNTAQGFWNPPRLALADVGAVSQASVARIIQGLIFQSPAGFRVLGAGGALTPVGLPVDRAVREFDVLGSLVVEKDQEVRFYGEDITYVYNYLYDTWSTWTCTGVGVAKAASGLALIARADGKLWIEDENTWTDGGATYSQRIRTSWLHGGNVGEFQRVRRVGAVGSYADIDLPTHNLRLELFFDSREFWEDRHEWTFPDSTTNSDTWGAATWGAGVWGDTTATVANLEDLSWDWERDPAIQKCNSISIALEDYNTDGPGFVLSAFSLELARKHGLNRGPTRTGTGSYRTNPSGE